MTALLTAGVAIAMPACAAQTYGYRGGYARELERRAYDNGYRDGVNAADKDVRRGRTFSMERHDDWRDADDGYHRDYGDREFYRRVFRDGFRAGYSETFNRYASGGYRGPGGIFAPPVYSGRVPYPQTYGYGSTAAQIGYRDGLEVGRNDARDGESYDPRRSKRYRSADHDYDRRYGSEDAYKREYRDAFQRGYDEGYRTAARRY
jgi:hypothetical protein